MMKLIRTRFILTVCKMAILTAAFTLHVKASVNDTIYMGRLQEFDTVAICSTFDSIMVLPVEGLHDFFWFVDDIDTLYVDTLFIPGNFSGNISCQGHLGSELAGLWIYVRPITFTGEDLVLYCGESKTARLFTNYTGIEEPSYSWSPQSGISNPGIINPIVQAETNTNYVVIMETEKGCRMTAEVFVSLKTMENPRICIISVDPSNKNVVYWDKPESEAIDSFLIYREENVTDQYKKIGSVKYEDFGYFKDTSSFPDVQSNKYRISLKDACGLESSLSTPHKTMHLSINAGLNKAWNLIWEPYNGFVVSTYNVYRGTNSKDLALIGTTSGSSTQYSDLEPPNDNVYYQVEVISPDPCDIDLPYKKQVLMPEKTIVTSTKSNIVDNQLIVTSAHEISVQCSIFPNPSSGQIFIALPTAYSDGATVEIYSMDGQLQMRTNIDSVMYAVQIDTLKRGYYMLQIVTATGSERHKICKL